MSYLEAEPRSARTHAIVDRLCRHFGRQDVARVGQESVDEAVRAIVGADAAPATKLRVVIAPVSAILHHAHRRGWRDAPKLDRPKIAAATPAWLTPAEAERLIDACAPHLAVLVTFLLCTGARLSEALYLPWRDVDLAGGRAVFVPERTKAQRERVAWLPPRAIEAMEPIPNRNGMVFRRDDGEPYAERDGEGGQIKTAFRAACRRAGLGQWGLRVSEAGPGRRWLPAVTPHDLRHSWASWSLCVHRDPLRLRDEGGWQSIAMVERYAHRAPAELAAAARAFWRTPDAQSPREGGISVAASRR